MSFNISPTNLQWNPTEGDFYQHEGNVIYPISTGQYSVPSLECILPNQEQDIYENYLFSQELPNLSGKLFSDDDSTQTNAELLESLSSDHYINQISNELLDNSSPELYTLRNCTELPDFVSTKLSNIENDIKLLESSHYDKELIQEKNYDPTSIRNNTYELYTNNAHVPIIDHCVESEKTNLLILPSEDADMLISLSNSYWDPKSVLLTKSAYSFAIEDIDVCDEMFKDFILKNIKKASSRRRSSSNYGRIINSNSNNIDLYLTFQRAKDFITSNIPRDLADAYNSTRIPILNGMSIDDIKGILAKNNDFFTKISEYCEQIQGMIENSGIDDISLIMQSKIKVSSQHALSIPSSKKRSDPFQKKIKEMLMRIASSLPQKILNEIENSSEISIRKWLFSECHGIYIYDKSIGEICNTIIKANELIINDFLLLSNIDDIAKTITKRNYRCSCVSVVGNHKLSTGKSVHSHINILSNQSLDQLRISLSKSLVIHNRNVVSLDKKTIEKMARCLIVDLQNISLKSYSNTCSSAAKNISLY
ncbi:MULTISPECIES: hypothetical protein [Candidatus Ichthyocystis]|uniref:Uncharacterized protein n=1 Tax=Candidatus Ichthyocystis hellenicum TaxID=1561003 RepID=A0A0S4M230_9BURK|nr:MULTISPECIES: hypothetical protein [Ichthyocystis]CUT17817.1 hypothetical protein Ark11_0998 [Candidatus Ichthyocystis hellenicum]